MRIILASVLLAVGCSKAPAANQSGASPASPASRASRPAAQPDEVPLALDHIRLLYPEDVLADRVLDVDGFSALVKRVSDLIVADSSGLPDRVDAFVVMRAGATRVWLVGPAGDLSALALERQLDQIGTTPIRTGYVAAVVTLVRGGVADRDSLRLPSSWKAAAGDGKTTDEVLVAVWPR